MWLLTILSCQDIVNEGGSDLTATGNILLSENSSDSNYYKDYFESLNLDAEALQVAAYEDTSAVEAVIDAVQSGNATQVVDNPMTDNTDTGNSNSGSQNTQDNGQAGVELAEAFNFLGNSGHHFFASDDFEFSILTGSSGNKVSYSNSQGGEVNNFFEAPESTDPVDDSQIL